MAKKRVSRRSSKAVRKSRKRTSGKRGSRKKRPLNAYMKALKKARKSNAAEFTYKGKKYVRKTKQIKPGLEFVYYKAE